MAPDFVRLRTAHDIAARPNEIIPAFKTRVRRSVSSMRASH
jgi:hypothetical protein